MYTDKHLREINGKLYYLNEKGECLAGWKTVNGHRYYFSQNDGTAVCGLVSIDGIVYEFNQNGICKGKHTGYAMQGGKKVYYKDGVLSEKAD